MEPETDRVLKLIAARTRHLQLIAVELRQGWRALTAFDLDGIYQSNAAQALLCAQVKRVDEELSRTLGTPAAPSGETLANLKVTSTEWTDQARETLISIIREHEAARVALEALNRVQEDFLQRSRRHLGILVRLVANPLGLYEAPKFRPRPACAGAGGV